MKTKKLLSLILASAMICAAMFSGCGSETQPTDNKPSEQVIEENKGGKESEKEEAKNEEKMAEVQELTYALASDAVTLDNAMGGNIPDQMAQAPLTEGLTVRKLNEDGMLVDVPGGAESWDANEDETVYTFHLRKEACWSDATPITAEDYVYSWRRAFDPNTASPSAWLLQDYIVNADACMKGEKPVEELGIKAIDDYTFEVSLTKPYNQFLTYAGFNFLRPVRKDLAEKYGTHYGSSADKFMGNGPYILSSWEIDSKMVYEPNPNYWNAENVHLTKVTRQIIKETSTLAQALMNGEVDIATMDDPDWNELVDQTSHYEIHEAPNMSLDFLVFNCEKPQLANPKIRLAISLAFDRAAFCSEVYSGKNLPAYSLSPDISVVGKEIYHEKVNDENYVIKKLQEKYPDPKELLIEGLKEEGMDPDPSKFTVHYSSRGTTEQVKKSSEWLKQQIEATLGINFVIELTEWNIMYDLVKSGDYEIAQCGWSVDTSLEPSEFLKIFEPKDGYYNVEKLHWVSDKTDRYSELVELMLNEKDMEKQAKEYLEAEQIIIEESPMSPVYCSKTRTLVGKNVKGYPVHSFLQPNFVGVYLTE